MIELFKNIVLASIAVLLSKYLIPVGVLCAIILCLVTFDYKLFLKYFNRLFYSIAKAIDILGNYTCAVLFNWTLLKKNESVYRFGKEGETISSVLGKNLRLNNLTKVGIALCDILDFFDKNHVIKSIDENIF